MSLRHKCVDCFDVGLSAIRMRIKAVALLQMAVRTITARLVQAKT